MYINVCIVFFLTMDVNLYKTSQWRRRFRGFWLTVHLYIALTVGFVFVILGLTGSVNVFIYELEELGLPQVRHEGNAQPRSLDEIMQTVKAAHPQKKGKWSLLLPNYGNDYLWVEYPKPEETADELYAPFRVLIDPYSGKIIAESYWGRTLWTLIYEVHASFLTGKLGVKIGEIGFDTICFLGLFFFVSALTGLYLWWPRWGKFKKAVTIKRGASPERFYFDLHKTTGFYSSIILLILAFTLLKAAGTPLGANDLWIACHALSQNATLVTHNLRAFERIAGLKLDDWAI